MNFLFLTGGLAVVVFVLAYLRPGRYGVATLALIAGHTLALFWADTLASTYRFSWSHGMPAYEDARRNTQANGMAAR